MGLKRKYADRPDWSRIEQKRYKQTYIEHEHFEGYIAMLCLDKVTKPLNVKYDENEICIVDDGYIWVQHFPIHANYALTTMFNAHGQIIQYYFDIVLRFGETSNGIPYFEDLFLDIVFLPNGKIFIKDEHELKEALDSGIIKNTEFALAHMEASRLIDSVRNNKNWILNNIHTHYELMKSL